MKHMRFSTAGIQCLGILAAVLLYCTPAPAQNTPFWSNNGNSNISTGDYLGTNIDEPLIFKTDQIERLRIGAEGEFIFSGFAGSGSGLFTFNNRGELTSLLFPGGSNYVLTGNGIFESTTKVTGWQTDGTANLRSASNLNVGIGTTGALRAKLDVNGSTRISSLAREGYSYVIADPSGNLVPIAVPDLPPNLPPADFFIPDPWTVFGNEIASNMFIGTVNDYDFVIKTNSVERARITTTGNAIVGTGANRIAMGSAGHQDLYWGSSYLGFNASRNPHTRMWTATSDNSHNGGSAIWSNMVGQMFFATIPSEPSFIGLLDQQVTDGTVAANVAMTITPDGRVGIGLASPNPHYKLSVKGKIIAEELRVRLYADWPDYVFREEYNLMPLSELENFIEKNKHLPNIPSAEQMSIEEGFDVGAMQARHLEKTEELFRYIIQMNKELQELKQKNEEQRTQIQSLLGK